MKQTLLAAILCGVCAAALAQEAPSQSCADYPMPGLDVSAVAAGDKYVSTASATVTTDSSESLRDALEEATMEAKAAISRFLKEDIMSDAAVQRVVNESVSMKGADKQVAREELVTRTKELRNHSQNLLRGVVVLGSCYTKGKEVRVTVGLKPETIQAARRGLAEMKSDVPLRSSTTSGNAASSGANSGTSGFSDRSRLDKF